VGAEDIGLKLKGINRAPVVDLETSMVELDRSAFFGTPVITGWFGEGDDGELALLGRGGCDHSATSIARLVDADKVILWKDVDGVLPLNPRWGLDSSPIPYLGYSEAVELARLDTPVLHPATVEPLRGIGIPLEIRDLRSIVKEQAASIIGPDLIQTHKVKAIGCLPNVTRLTVSSSSLEVQSEHLGRVLIDLATENIACWNLDSIPGQISWIVSQHDLQKARQIVTNYFSTPDITEYGVMFSLVGNKLPNEENALLSPEMISLLELEIVSVTDHAVRVISSRHDVSSMLDTLANHLDLTAMV
jgi:aspartate kinase